MKPLQNQAWRVGAVAAVRRLAQRRYLLLSVLVHSGVLLPYYYLGSYQPRMRALAQDVDSSLRATDLAGATQRLEDLGAIKKLFEKSAARAQVRYDEPAPAPADTPEKLVMRAREVSRTIDALDRELRVNELKRLLGQREAATKPTLPHPEAVPPPLTPDHELLVPDAAQMTAEMAANEIAALEAKAREALLRHRARLDAKANGIEVESGSTKQEHGNDSAVLSEIDDFMGGSERIGPVAGLQSAGGSAADIVGDGDVMVPPVDASAMVPGHGRMLGVGGEYANRIYVNSWYIIGPFPGGSRGRQPDNSNYPPERAVLLDAAYLGKDGRLVKWRYVNAQSYPLIPPDATEDAVYFGYTEVSVDRDCDLTAWIGADDNAQIYLNGRRVWAGGTVSLMRYLYAIWEPGTTHLHDYNLTEARRVLHFRSGRNKLFFKLSNGFQGTHLSLVLTRDAPCH